MNDKAGSKTAESYVSTARSSMKWNTVGKQECRRLKMILMVLLLDLRKSEVSVERISVCNVIENLALHGLHSLPCSYTNDLIDMLP